MNADAQQQIRVYLRSSAANFFKSFAFFAVKRGCALWLHGVHIVRRKIY